MKTTCDQKVRLSKLSREVLFRQLCDYSTRWGDIGGYLGFTLDELDKIHCLPMLFANAPQSWLKRLLDEWLDWVPGDARGSTSFATLDDLKAALIKCGLETAANNLHGNILDSAIDLGKVIWSKVAM